MDDVGQDMLQIKAERLFSELMGGGADPRPVAGVIFVGVDALLDAGHTQEGIATMLRKIADNVEALHL